MSRLTDDELRRHVGRRASRQPLSVDDRREVLASISDAARVHRRPIYMFGWPIAGVASAAVAVLVLVVTGSLLLPRVVPSPGPVASPGVPSATPSVARPSESPNEPELRIYTTSQASELAADAVNEGRVIIVALDPSWPCPGDVSCDDAGFVAVRLDRDAAHVGGVALMEGGRPWMVEEVLAKKPPGLVAVKGWLVDSPLHSCPMPRELADDDPTNNELKWYCANGWITPEPHYTTTPTERGVQFHTPDESLIVQVGAYQDYATDPSYTPRGSEPRLGVYLLRSAGCQTTIYSECPVWEIVARVEPPLAMPVVPSPSSTSSGSQHEILGAVGEWIASEEQPFEGSVYVHSVVTDVGFLRNTYGPGAQDRELRDAGPPLFGGRMTEPKQEAVDLALRPTTAEFISDIADIREPDREPGVCEPFLGSRFLIQLGPPRPNGAGDGYFVTVQVGNGCHGWTRVVEVTATDGEYTVTRVVIDGGFIVD